MNSNGAPDGGSGKAPASATAGQSLPEQVQGIPAGPILFVDGHCVLCQRAAQWVLRHDRRGRVALAALQGRTAHRLLDGRGKASVAASSGSLVWRQMDGRIRVRSAAVLAVAAALGGWYGAAAAVLWLVPLPLRDGLYLALARRRRRWFGTTDRCQLPTASHGSRLLD